MQLTFARELSLTSTSFKIKRKAFTYRKNKETPCDNSNETPSEDYIRDVKLEKKFSIPV